MSQNSLHYVGCKMDTQMIVENYINNISISCINRAAVEFHVLATLIVSVLCIERGANGLSAKIKMEPMNGNDAN